MILSDFFRLRYSAFVLVACSGVLCYLTYRLGEIKDQEIKAGEQQTYAFLIGAVPLAIGLTSWTINQEIKEISDETVRKVKIEKDETLGRYKAMYSSNLEFLKEKLEPLKLSGKVYEACLVEIEKCQSLIYELEKKEKASNRISEWLDVKNNRKSLKEYAVSAVPKNQIPPHTQGKFRKDIGRCINWLRNSINKLQGYEVRRDVVATAYLDLPSGLATYITALQSMKFHPTLKELSEDSKVLEDFIDELIEKLQA